MSQQHELPIEYQINQLIHKSVPVMSRNDLSQSGAAREELKRKIKTDPEWKKAFHRLCVDTVTRVLLAQGRSATCLHDRRKEVDWMLDLAIETHPPLRNGLRLPHDPPETPKRPD